MIYIYIYIYTHTYTYTYTHKPKKNNWRPTLAHGHAAEQSQCPFENATERTLEDATEIHNVF